MSTRESSISAGAGSASTAVCFEYLARHGLLMKADTKLPSVTAMVAGESVKGSWWAHPLAHTIFFALRDLADHADVLLLKLAAGKDPFVTVASYVLDSDSAGRLVGDASLLSLNGCGNPKLSRCETVKRTR
jgi:hypothetical protein